MDGGKTKHKDHGGRCGGKAEYLRRGFAEGGLDSGFTGCSPEAMPAADMREDSWPWVGTGSGIVHLTVYGRCGSKAQMQLVYVVYGERGNLFVRAFAEPWRLQAERLEVALNNGVARWADLRGNVPLVTR
jgi:hypothetical protein